MHVGHIVDDAKFRDTSHVHITRDVTDIVTSSLAERAMQFEGMTPPDSPNQTMHVHIPKGDTKRADIKCDVRMAVLIRKLLCGVNIT